MDFNSILRANYLIPAISFSETTKYQNYNLNYSKKKYLIQN